jgi:hypothetical protein
MKVYLIHFDQPFRAGTKGECRHYGGWHYDKETLQQALDRHAGSTGSKFMRSVINAGIPWRVVRIWEDANFDIYRQLKGGNAAKYCPICQGEQSEEIVS